MNLVKTKVGMVNAAIVIEIGFVCLMLTMICIQYLKNENDPFSTTLSIPNTWNSCDVNTWYETAHVKLAIK